MTERSKRADAAMKVYSPPLLQEVLTGNTLGQALREEARSSSAPGTSRSNHWYEGDAEADSLRERIQQQRAIREAEMARQQAAFQASFQRQREVAERRRDEKLNSLLSDVLAGMSVADGPVAEAEAALAHADKVRTKKKESLHAEWSSKVFDTIQGRLQAAVDSRDPRAIEARLKGQYDQYLHTTNTKVGVFRDVIIEQDYNPLAAGQATIRVPTGDIQDPLKRDVLKGERERQQMMSSGLLGSGGGTGGGGRGTWGGRSASASSTGGRGGGGGGGGGGGDAGLGKETFDTRQWGELAVTATPYGHCNDGSGAYVVRPLSGSARRGNSHVAMDHYNFPRGNEHAAAEVPPGKRILPGPEQRRGRADLFDVLHHACNLKPEGYTGGDQWLEARGKAHPPGPEQRRGRRDLSDVIQMRPPPDRPAAADGGGGGGGAAPVTGDQWLDAKGKARAEGPEVRRGRAGLYETLHQTSNPYEGGSTVGDSWLEHKGKRVLPPIASEAGAALAGVPPPAVARRPPDEKKYGTQLAVLDGQLTVKE